MNDHETRLSRHMGAWTEEVVGNLPYASRWEPDEASTTMEEAEALKRVLNQLIDRCEEAVLDGGRGVGVDGERCGEEHGDE